MKPIVRIGFDADDVMFDTEHFIKKQAVSFFRKKYQLEVQNENGYNVKEMFDCTEEQQTKFWTKNVIKYSLFFEPLQNLVEMLKKLKNDSEIDYQIHVVTSKYKSLEPGVGQIVKYLFELGLKKHHIFQYIDKIHYCSLENSREDKAKVCFDEKLLIFIEDRVSNILYLQECFSKEQLNIICKNTNNNKQFDLPEITRVDNYNGIYHEIQKIVDRLFLKPSFMGTFLKLTQDKRKELTSKELLEYYKNYREFIENLPFNKKRMLKGEKFYHRLSKIISFFFKNKYKPFILEKELIPNDKGLIFISNHQTDKDFLLLLTVLDGISWHPLLKKEFLDNPISRIISQRGYSVYVDRGNVASRKDATVEMAKILINGGNLLIFPEGTYTKSQKNVDYFKGKSPMYLSQFLDKYIVPISITQNYDKKERPIVRFNEPLRVNVSEDLNIINQELYNRIDEGIEKNKIFKREIELNKNEKLNY